MVETSLIEEYVPLVTYQVLQTNLSNRTERALAVQTEECLKFLIIQSNRNCGFIPVTHSVDEVWHELILQTRFYANLCASLPGGRFLHHESMTAGQYVASRGSHVLIDEFLSWIPQYVTRFGPFTPERATYWSVCNYLINRHSLTLKQINLAGADSKAQAALSKPEMP